MSECSFSAGAAVFHQGEPGDDFFCITSGTAQVLRRDEDGSNEDPKVIAELTEGDAFGERALLKNEPRFAGVVATTPLQCQSISRDLFETVVGPLDQLLEYQEHSVRSDSY